MTAGKKLRGLGRLQPRGIGATLPEIKPPTKAVGTIANPYFRKGDKTQVVKATFSLSLPVVERLNQFELKLKRFGIGRNTWVEELIKRGLKERFLLEEAERARAEAEDKAGSEQDAAEEETPHQEPTP